MWGHREALLGLPWSPPVPGRARITWVVRRESGPKTEKLEQGSNRCREVSEAAGHLRSSADRRQQGAATSSAQHRPSDTQDPTPCARATLQRKGIGCTCHRLQRLAISSSAGRSSGRAPSGDGGAERNRRRCAAFLVPTHHPVVVLYPVPYLYAV